MNLIFIVISHIINTNASPLHKGFMKILDRKQSSDSGASGQNNSVLVYSQQSR
jgi:hypothetical protein